MNLMVCRVTSAAAMRKRADSTRQNHALRRTRSLSHYREPLLVSMTTVVAIFDNARDVDQAVTTPYTPDPRGKAYWRLGPAANSRLPSLESTV
jgi:hypothetical protein